MNGVIYFCIGLVTGSVVFSLIQLSLIRGTLDDIKEILVYLSNKKSNNIVEVTDKERWTNEPAE